MSEPRWMLQLTFKNDHGDNYHMAIDLDHSVARSFSYIEPLPPAEISNISFDEAITVLKKRQLRKDLFIKEATRLGQKLAEYMEDKEGWHGVPSALRNDGETRSGMAAEILAESGMNQKHRRVG